jgi:hypothetical protein
VRKFPRKINDLQISTSQPARIPAMLTERDLVLLEAVRRRHAARHARERAKSIVRKDRRPDTLAAGRAHRAMLKLYARADTELRTCELHPAVASLPALAALGAELRHAVDDVRERASRCTGSPAADAMRKRMLNDASLSMRLVRRINTLLRNAPPASANPPALPTLTPITPPPIPSVPAPLYHVPDPSAPPEARRSEYYWETIVRRADGSLAEWQAQRKKATKQYLQSEKGKEATKQYLQSEKGKEARKRYAQSEKGKAARKRYAQSEKGKAALKRAQDAYRAKKAAQPAAKQP